MDEITVPWLLAWVVIPLLTTCGLWFQWNTRQAHKRISTVRESFQAFQLEVTKTFIAKADLANALKAIEKRLERIETKIDRNGAHRGVGS